MTEIARALLLNVNREKLEAATRVAKKPRTVAGFAMIIANHHGAGVTLNCPKLGFFGGASLHQ
jgi:hypothetical protein